MGIGSFFTRVADKSVAASMSQEWLKDMHSRGHVRRSPAAFANKLVQMAWEIWPREISGQLGYKPQPYTTAVASIAAGIKLLSTSDPDRSGLIYLYGLLTVKRGEGLDVTKFGQIDEALIESADQIYFQTAKEVEP